jgi:predicted outer membrane repeat protein
MLTNCKFGANSAVTGGAIYITGEFLGTLTDSVFENNIATLGGGTIYCKGSGELKIIRCKFRNGTANRGGVIYNGHASLILSECILEGNQAKYAGAISTGGDITLTNCLLADNQALVYGGALDNMGYTSRFVNCTFVGNSAEHGGAIFSNIECDTIAINCIFWNNTAETGSQIATSGDHGGSTLTVNYCDIENGLDGLYVPSGCALNWGENNIDAEPLFVDSDNGDHRLSASSPCIDAGDPNYIAGPNETDLDGKPRVINGRIDMGVYEYEYGQLIHAEARIVPRTINLASKGKWITCYIWLPDEYDVADIEPDSIFLEDEIQPEEFSVDEQQQVATARFSREVVQPILEVGDINIKITGILTDGTVFEAADTIKVLNKAGK